MTSTPPTRVLVALLGTSLSLTACARGRGDDTERPSEDDVDDTEFMSEPYEGEEMPPTTTTPRTPGETQPETPTTTTTTPEAGAPTQPPTPTPTPTPGSSPEGAPTPPR